MRRFLTLSDDRAANAAAAMFCQRFRLYDRACRRQARTGQFPAPKLRLGGALGTP